MIINLDFKVRIFYKAKYLKNGKRCSYTYNGRLTGSGVIYDLLNGAVFSDFR